MTVKVFVTVYLKRNVFFILCTLLYRKWELKPKVIIFTDIDGTILDENYDYSQIHEIIHKLVLLDSSIVLTSSKTKAEVELYRRKLAINEPFIVENGSAIIIPKNFFVTKYGFTKENHFYRIIELGMDYSTVRKKLALLQEKNNATIIGFGDMTIKEVANDTGLPVKLASLAKKREYDEPFKIIDGQEKEILRSIEQEGLSYTKGGRYLHLLGNTDKGKAVAILKQLYLQEFIRIVTIGVGDSENDIPMLGLVDNPFKIDGKDRILSVWCNILKSVESQSRD